MDAILNVLEGLHFVIKHLLQSRIIQNPWAYESGGGVGGGTTALPNSGKTVEKIRAKQEECVKFRPNQPLCPP